MPVSRRSTATGSGFAGLDPGVACPGGLAFPAATEAGAGCRMYSGRRRRGRPRGLARVVAAAHRDHPRRPLRLCQQGVRRVPGLVARSADWHELLRARGTGRSRAHPRASRQAAARRAGSGRVRAEHHPRRRRAPHRRDLRGPDGRGHGAAIARPHRPRRTARQPGEACQARCFRAERAQRRRRLPRGRRWPRRDRLVGAALLARGRARESARAAVSRHAGPRVRGEHRPGRGGHDRTARPSRQCSLARRSGLRR